MFSTSTSSCFLPRLALRQLVKERLHSRPGDLGVLLAGAAADTHRADHLAVHHDGHAAEKRRDLAPAGLGRDLQAEVQERVGVGVPAGIGPVGWRKVAAVVALVIAV